MKDIISAISGIVALLVFITCIVIGVNYEQVIIRTIISLLATNLIGQAAFGLVVVTMKNNRENEEIAGLDELNPNDKSNKAALSA